MTRFAASRLLLAVGGVGTAVLLLLALGGLPDLGAVPHPYADRAVHAALDHDTANVVSSVNFDQRAFDTLGEEFVLFAAAVAAVLLLRRVHDEEEGGPDPHYGPPRGWGAPPLVGVAPL